MRSVSSFLWRARAVRTLAVLIVALAAVPPAAWARTGLSSIVIDAETGKTLAADNADLRHHPASLAKMMTLYLAFEAVSQGRASLTDRFAVSHYAASRPPTRLGLHPGDTVALKDLMLALVTQSANDAAVVMAEGLAGGEDDFAERMTAKARELGMRTTVFRNASGLPDPRAWTTARDMSLLARALLEDYRSYYQYFATREFDFRGHTYRNHNRLLGRYEGLDGIKTGYTRASGFHLAASAKRGSRRVIAVVRGGRSWALRDREMVGLLDTAFAHRDPGTRTPVLHALADGVGKAAHALSPIATASAAAEPSSLAGKDPERPGDWSVQVGAFSTQGAAENRADAIMVMDERLTPENKRIVASRKGNRQLYVVRFADLSEDDAKDVCAEMRSAGHGCYAAPALP